MMTISVRTLRAKSSGSHPIASCFVRWVRRRTVRFRTTPPKKLRRSVSRLSSAGEFPRDPILFDIAAQSSTPAALHRDRRRRDERGGRIFFGAWVGGGGGGSGRGGGRG